MPAGYLHLVFSALAAIVSIGMWLDYFRRIDVFEKERAVPLLVALITGGCTPYVSLFIYSFFEKVGFNENGHLLNDLLYSIFGIGLNEELSKLLGVIVVFRLLKKYVNEPIDYLIYAGMTALGFSMVENFYYFNNHGLHIITSRSFYSALEHIINTTIVVYGIYRHRIFGKGSQVLNTAVALSLAVCSHGLFDFFLIQASSLHVTVFFSIVIYLVGINFWVQMLNNANNFSNFFDYDKIHRSGKIVYRLLFWYALTLLIAFINNAIAVDPPFSVITLLTSLISDGFLFFVVIMRVSRFKILKSRYLDVRLQFPFYVTRNKDEDFRLFTLPLKIRGENSREHMLTRYLNRSVWLVPASKNKSLLKRPEMAQVQQKVMLHHDVVVYLVSIYNLQPPDGAIYLLKPEMGGFKDVSEHLPLHGLYEAPEPKNPVEMSLMRYKDLNFIEWVFLRSDDPNVKK